jgi:DNA-binding PadR family transcriptional regulator
MITDAKLKRMGRAAMVLGTFALMSGSSGCSNPTKPNEANFGKAIQAYLDEAYPKCLFYGKFPIETPEFDLGNVRPALRALSAAGVLTETATKRRGHFVYDLTDEGRKAFKPNMRVAMNGDKMGGICTGKAVLQSITRFTEPADLMGAHVSQVTYRFEVRDLPAWTSNPAILDVKRFDVLNEWRNSAKEPLVSSDTVVLTNQGWVHENMMKKS